MQNKNNILIHNYKIAAKGIKKKVFYHFSDVHLTEYDELSDNEEKTAAIEQTHYWEDMRCEFAQNYNEDYVEPNKISTHTHFLNMMSAAKDGDALILTGDVCDYINGANLRIIERELENFSQPVMYVIGNHEEKEKMPDAPSFFDVKKPVQMLEFEDLIVFGVDNSKREITAEQNTALKRALALGKPMIIAMHVPIMTEENRALIEESGEYFEFNNDSASEEVFEFVETIKQHSNQIITVLAGHLHFMNNSKITDDLTQYVATQGALGNMNRYEIG